MFFQWRQSRRGAEKFHSAMLPHGGTETRVWREVVQLGASVEELGQIRGTRTQADVAVVWDWQSWWAQKLEWRPSEDHDARERADAFYEALYDRHLTVDFAHPEADLSAYPLVVVPALYLMTEAAGRNLQRYVEQGGTLVVSYFSGIVDEHDAVHEGAYPGALRDVLGLTVEEFSPLLADQRVRITGPDGSELTGDVWTEFVVPRGAETVWTYAEGLTADHPAVTRHRLGEGTAWYVSTRLDAHGLDALLGWATEDARIAPRAELPYDVEVVRREGESGGFLFVINHSASDVKVPLGAAGTELLTGEPAAGDLAVPAGAVRVLRLDG
jgi:beta-galactosidase